jgi:hypothetical protein
MEYDTKDLQRLPPSTMDRDLTVYRARAVSAANGTCLEHGVSHFQPFSTTRSCHELTCLMPLYSVMKVWVKYFNNFCHRNALRSCFKIRMAADFLVETAIRGACMPIDFSAV